MSWRLPVKDYLLRDLVASAPGTVADRLPLVCHHDVIEGSWSQALRHVDFLSLYVTERGRGLHLIGSTPYSISRGDVYVMGVGAHHSFAEGERLLLDAIHFSPAAFDAPTWHALRKVPGFDSLLVGRAGSTRLHLTPAAYADVARDLAELWAEWREGTSTGALMVPALLLGLLVRLARLAAGEAPPSLGSPTPTAHREEIVAAAVRRIDLGYSEPLRVEQLAASVYLSPDRFTEVFAAVMGRTPRDYIRHVRLERAKTLLASTVLPISEVARASGFGDSAYFSRAFRAATGVAPRAFRRGARGQTPSLETS
jgi:AraC-like DNA-binding protein